MPPRGATVSKPLKGKAKAKVPFPRVPRASGLNEAGMPMANQLGLEAERVYDPDWDDPNPIAYTDPADYNLFANSSSTIYADTSTATNTSGHLYLDPLATYGDEYGFFGEISFAAPMVGQHLDTSYPNAADPPITQNYRDPLTFGTTPLDFEDLNRLRNVVPYGSQTLQGPLHSSQQAALHGSQQHYSQQVLSGYLPTSKPFRPGETARDGRRVMQTRSAIDVLQTHHARQGKVRPSLPSTPRPPAAALLAHGPAHDIPAAGIEANDRAKRIRKIEEMVKDLSLVSLFREGAYPFPDDLQVLLQEHYNDAYRLFAPDDPVPDISKFDKEKRKQVLVWLGAERHKMKVLACTTVLAHYGLNVLSTTEVKVSIGHLINTSTYLHTQELDNTGQHVIRYFEAPAIKALLRLALWGANDSIGHRLEFIGTSQMYIPTITFVCCLLHHALMTHERTGRYDKTMLFQSGQYQIMQRRFQSLIETFDEEQRDRFTRLRVDMMSLRD